MKIQTYSIIAGSEACNARCPYCVSKMTPTGGLDYKLQDINWRNFEKGCMYARDNGVSTAMITGKGEPTLFPEQITNFMHKLEPHKFPFIELQTNGVAIGEDFKKYRPHLREWYKNGMTTIAISIVHYDQEKNKQIYSPHKEEYPELETLIDNLHGEGFAVRLSCTMLEGYIDSAQEIEKLIEYARKTKTEQITVRPVNKPEKSRNQEVYDWTSEHQVSEKKIEEIKEFLENEGTVLQDLAHGARVYDLDGQNICLTNSLTIKPESEDIRQLIFFPDGHLRYDWSHMGAMLI